MVQTVFQKLQVKDRVNQLLEYFQFDDRVSQLRKTAHIVKLQVGNRAMGKPLIDQYEQIKKATIDMVQNTKEIIERERRHIEE